MPVYVSKDNTIYFANGLDNGYIYIYSIDSTSSNKRIDFSTSQEFKYESDTALFISDTPL